jgi:predicted PurR-regulated permease PerM
MPIELSDRQRRLLDAILILGVLALVFVVGGFATTLFYAFGDILLQFFLAWLLSFALLPLINGVHRLVPRMPQAGAVILVYLGIVGILLGVLVQASASLASSINEFIKDAPNLQDQLTNVLRELQERLFGFGFSVDLVSQAPVIVANLQTWAGELVGPLQSIALASVGFLGNLLILVILSIYIAIDREDIGAFLFRLVPPSASSAARLLSTSVSRSFGGFLRTQLIMGLAFGLITAIVNVVFGLPYGAVTVFTAGILHAIPFFGPFVSWVPPVAVALLLAPGAVLPVVIVMAVGWFVTMNVLQPRLMSGAVGIHPIVVLGSVVVGTKVAGIAGAIFGIPIAAVLSAFFFYAFERTHENGSVADRATKRLEAREGRPVRRPREPHPGEDDDLDEVVGGRHAHPAYPAHPAPPAPTSATVATAAATAAAPDAEP